MEIEQINNRNTIGLLCVNLQSLYSTKKSTDLNAFTFFSKSMDWLQKERKMERFQLFEKVMPVLIMSLSLLIDFKEVIISNGLIS